MATRNKSIPAKKTNKPVSVFTAQEQKIVAQLRPLFEVAEKSAGHSIEGRKLAKSFADSKGKYRQLLNKHGMTHSVIQAAAKDFQATYKSRVGITVSKQSTKSKPSNNPKVQLLVLLMAEVTGITYDLMNDAANAKERLALTFRAKQALYRMLPKKDKPVPVVKLDDYLVDLGRSIWEKIDPMPRDMNDPVFKRIMKGIWAGLEDANTPPEETTEGEAE